MALKRLGVIGQATLFATGVGVPRSRHVYFYEAEEEEVNEETERKIKEIERIGSEIERVLLRIGSSQE